MHALNDNDVASIFGNIERKTSPDLDNANGTDVLVNYMYSRDRNGPDTI